MPRMGKVIEIYDSAFSSEAEAPWSVTAAYDGHRHRLKVKTEPGSDSIVLDEEDAQRLARHLGGEAADYAARVRADRQWRTGGPHA